VLRQAVTHNKLGDVGRGPGKSFLFFVRMGTPGIALSGDRDQPSVKHCSYGGVGSASVGP